ncbi:MAG: peptidase M61, partial [Alphaproteobacteria bacterium]|nr:peptidase M61 [Alphaproteobacteria bacterium]
MRRILPVLLLSVMTAGASAQTSGPYPGPQPVPMPPPIPAPQDIPYPGGTIRLSVDATDPAQGIMRVHEVIPVAKSGPMVLLYPRWLPGNHAPNGPINKFAGLTVQAGGKTVPWQRDTADVYAFHIDVPEGAREVALDFQYLSPVESRE